MFYLTLALWMAGEPVQSTGMKETIAAVDQRPIDFQALLQGRFWRVTVKGDPVGENQISDLEVK